jgi:hypothetical protein
MQYKNLTAIMSDLSKYADETSCDELFRIAKIITIRGNSMIMLMEIHTDYYVTCALVGISDELTAIIESTYNTEYSYACGVFAYPMVQMWQIVMINLIGKYGIKFTERLSKFTEN